MKTRNGFVSNSSTSSFCIFGVSVDQSDFYASLTEEAKKALSIKRGDVDEDEDGWYETSDSFQSTEFQEALGIDLELHSYDGDYIYIGRSFSDIGDDETGSQFKAKIIADISKVFKFEEPEFGCHEEAWHD